MGDDGLHDVWTTDCEVDRERRRSFRPLWRAVACKYCRMAAASAVCVETKRTGSPPVLA
jgi:hypothetical protein